MTGIPLHAQHCKPCPIKDEVVNIEYFHKNIFASILNIKNRIIVNIKNRIIAIISSFVPGDCQVFPVVQS